MTFVFQVFLNDVKIYLLTFFIAFFFKPFVYNIGSTKKRLNLVQF